VELLIEMIHGTENALLVHIVKNLWLGKDSLPEMTNPIAPIVLVNYSQSDVLPVPSQSQVLVALDSSPLRAVIGIMIALFAPLVVDLWLARDLSLMQMISFVRNVLRKNSWQIQSNNDFKNCNMRPASYNIVLPK
jgi:hypothetical protein